MKIPAILRVYLRIYLILLLIVVAGLILFSDINKLYFDDRTDTIIDLTDNWTAPDGSTVSLDGISAGQYGDSALFTKILPRDLQPNDELCFVTSNSNVTVWVGGTVAYEFDAGENITGRGYGRAYHTVNLGTENSGSNVRIRLTPVFNSGKGGRIAKVVICEAPVFRSYILKGSLLPFLLSAFITISGILIMILRWGIPKNQKLPYNLVALGAALTIAGVWLTGDTGVLQVIFGHIRFWRGVDYLLLLFSITPTLAFTLSFVKKQRGVFVHFTFIMPLVVLAFLFITRYAMNIDMSRYGVLIYFSYALTLVSMLVITVDNDLYCRKNGIKPNLKFFYIGGGAFVIGAAIDICIVASTYKSGIIPSRGYCMRIGLTILVVTMITRITKWWVNEQSSIARDRFVNKILQYSLGSSDADTKINLVMEYLGRELEADRAYIFEEVKENVFDNTYEWCATGVSKEIDNLKGLPYEGVVDVWYDEYKKNNSVLIYDLEEYKEVSLNIYNVLKPQGIKTLITAPLEVNGKYIGFFGVDNPPAEAMNEIREILRLLTYFISQLIIKKQYENKLVYYSYYDSLTAVRNRRAIREFEEQDFDPASPYGFMMCDVNGLKIMNDSQGHEAGDSLLKDVAGSLSKVFGNDNVYRVGGDEFAVYDCASSKEGFNRKVEEARSLIAGLGRSVSMGYIFNDTGEINYEKIKTQVDALMYEEKRKYYEGRHDRRH